MKERTEARRSEERVRFCESCNAVIGWYATYCEECGRAIGAAGEGSGPPAPAAVPQVQRELFKAHMRLVHRALERGAQLNKQVVWIQKEVEREESRPGSVAGEQRILLLAERLIDLEHEWEETQRAYNRGSETIEEDFLERIGDLEADLELPPDLQSAVNDEVQRLVRLLEKLEGGLAEVGRRIDVARRRQRHGRVLGFALAPWKAWTVTVAFGAAALGGAWWLLLQRIALPPEDLALPGGLCLLALAWFAFQTRPR